MTRSAFKILLDERELPSLAALTATIQGAHAAARPAAIHCVTRAEIVLACAALREAGALPGDRIEHAAVTPPEVVELLSGLGVTVVTQPGFVHARGDSYLEEVEASDVPWLYRCKGLIDGGVPLGGSTDAPYGDPDPWLAMRAAVDRATAAGKVLGGSERITPERALALFTTAADAPGGDPRTIAPGAVADLCLLDRPWSRARQELSSSMVRVTLQDGRLIRRA